MNDTTWIGARDPAEDLDRRTDAILNYILSDQKAERDPEPYEELHTFLSEADPDPDSIWQVQDLIVKGGVALILGPEKSMKSIAAAQLAIASVVPGAMWLGSRVQQATPWLIEEEGTRHGWKLRMRKLTALFPTFDREQHLIRWSLRRGFDLMERDSLRFLVRGILRDGIDLVIAGPISMVTSIEDENASGEWKRLGRILQRLCAKTGVTIVVIHHSRKPDDRKPKTVRNFFNTARGSNALTGMVDSAIGIEKEEEDDHGHIWTMQREDSRVPARQYFTVDRETLRIVVTDEPNAAQEKLSRVEETLYDNGPTTIRQYQLLTGVSHSTAERLLNGAAEIADASVRRMKQEGNNAYFYDLTPERRAEIDASRGIQPSATEPDLEYVQDPLMGEEAPA